MEEVIDAAESCRRVSSRQSAWRPWTRWRPRVSPSR